MNKKFLFAVIAATVMGNAWADDGRILTTQTYVDNELSGKVDITQGTGDNDENVGKTLVVNSSGNLELGTVSADNFVEDNITDGVTNKAPSENAVHDALENKQNKIPASEWQDVSNNTIPGVIVSTDEDGVVEQRMILDKTGNITGESIDEMVQYGEASQGILDDIRHDSVTEDDVNNAVPTTTMTVAIANAAANVNNPKLAWSSSLQTPINNYSTTFGITSDTWPRNRENYVPTAETFANGLALKQNKIPAENGGLILGQQAMTGMKSVLAPTATPGVVNQIGLWDADGMDSESWNINSAYEPSDRSVIRASIPTVGAVETGLNTKQKKIPAGTAGNVVTYSGTAGTVGSVATANAPTYNATTGALTNGTSIATIAAVDTKQNTIATDMVDFTEPEEQIDYELPSLVTYDSANGVNGTRIGLVDLDNGGAGITFLAGDTNPRDSVNAVYDNYVPTFRTVAAGLGDIWNEMPERLYWSSSLQTPINNYSKTFSSASNTWPNDQQYKVPTAETFANGLALKQNKIPAGTAGNVVTYSGTAGTVGSVATANAPTYNATTGELTNGTSIATIAAVDTKQNKMTCTRWLDTPEHPEHNDDNCLLWDLGN